MEKNRNENIETFTGRYSIPARRSKEQAWEMLNHRIEQAENHKTRKFSKASLIIGSIAAVFVFVFILYTGMFNTGKYSPDVNSGIASVKEYFLPDSSVVYLNSNSTIKYHYNNFTGERNVVLKGEALFDVKEGRRFIVEFEGGKAKVLGTVFNISAYSGNYMQFDCAEGSIELNLDVQRKRIRLSEGEGFYVSNEQISGLHDVNIDSIYERMNGIYHWETIRLDHLLSFISLRFGYSYDFRNIDPARKFSGKVDLTDMNTGLNIVSYAMGIDYSVSDEEKTVTFHAKSN
ncbi:MAG: FecR domain-containing protein [Prolixibacteraceae bacterium]|jgi:transmembrane sensor|nr:FecR domain-containing protein [Prolixibacteraceae bacterium]